jgi:hypothetical protein
MSQIVQGNWYLQAVLTDWFASNLNGIKCRLFSNNAVFDRNSNLSVFTECAFPGYASQSLGPWGTPTFNGTYWQIVAPVLTFSDTGAGPDNVYGFFLESGGNFLCAQTFPSAPIVLGTLQPTLGVIPIWQYTDIP